MVGLGPQVPPPLRLNPLTITFWLQFGTPAVHNCSQNAQPGLPGPCEVTAKGPAR